MRALCGLGLIFVLAGCATIPDTPEQAALEQRPVQPRMHADLVFGMLAKGQNYAALAHIEELERRSDADQEQLTWLRALTLYKLDQLAESEQAYRSLLDSGDYAGRAHHGLGLIAARSNLRDAVLHFNQAVRLLPTDAEIRNDLGYTLMLAGRLTEARHHLATATELAPESGQSRSNLVLSFLLEGLAEQAEALSQSFGMSREELRALQAESRIIQGLIAQRAAEFSTPATQVKEHNDEQDSRQSDRRSIPGLYSRQR